MVKGQYTPPWLADNPLSAHITRIIRLCNKNRKGRRFRYSGHVRDAPLLHPNHQRMENQIYWEQLSSTVLPNPASGLATMRRTSPLLPQRHSAT